MLINKRQILMGYWFMKNNKLLFGKNVHGFRVQKRIFISERLCHDMRKRLEEYAPSTGKWDRLR